MGLDRLTPAERRRFETGEWLTPLEGDEMDDQLSMLAGNTTQADTPPPRLARATDPPTSHKAAERVSYRTGTQKARLLEVYRTSFGPLTDDQAGELAGVRQAWKRCADLRRDGAIRSVGEIMGRYGTEVMVCEAVR